MRDVHDDLANVFAFVHGLNGLRHLVESSPACAVNSGQQLFRIVQFKEFFDVPWHA